jgi:hypothetical protein
MLIAIAAISSGCAATNGVRYVYQDGDYGVVGIPENTNRWPTRYHDQAEKLMTAHFPDGHEIVRAEEVIEGSRTLILKGTKSAEIAPQFPSELVKIAKLGRTDSRSQADTLKVTECRIIYRKSRHHEEGFAQPPTLTPTQYVDPNAVERRKAAASEKSDDWKAETARTERRKQPDHPSDTWFDEEDDHMKTGRDHSGPKWDDRVLKEDAFR